MRLTWVAYLWGWIDVQLHNEVRDKSLYIDQCMISILFYNLWSPQPTFKARFYKHSSCVLLWKFQCKKRIYLFPISLFVMQNNGNFSYVFLICISYLYYEYVHELKLYALQPQFNIDRKCYTSIVDFYRVPFSS